MINQPIKSQGEQELPGVPVWVYCDNPYSDYIYVEYMIAGEDYSNRPTESQLSWTQIYQDHHETQETALEIYIINNLSIWSNSSDSFNYSFYRFYVENGKAYLQLTGSWN